MQLDIKRGTVARPQRIVIYAPEGLGKSTLASELPDALFLDYEKGTHHLDVARIEPKTLKETESVLTQLAKDGQGFKTLVIDTVDWLEELVIQDVCEAHKKSGLEDFGYGKGYVFLAERFNGILTQLNACAAHLDIVLLAHSHVKKFELPDGAGAFDRYELKLSRQVGPLVREWCDALLFGNWKTKLRERDDGPVTTYKGIGGKERMIYASHAASWDAKNRHGLKDEEPWGLATVAKCLGAVGVSAKPASTPAKAERTVIEKAKERGVGEKPASISTVVTPAEDTIPMGEHPLLVVVGENEADVNAYLLSRAVIKEGQTFRDVTADYITKVQKNPAGFMAQAMKGKGVAA